MPRQIDSSLSIDTTPVYGLKIIPGESISRHIIRDKLFCQDFGLKQIQNDPFKRLK
jgi:hypothetical protein